MLLALLKKTYIILFNFIENISKKFRLRKYFKNGRIPWSVGYTDYRIDLIKEILEDDNINNKFISRNLEPGFGIGVDERIIEYPWILSRLSKDKTTFLDAGSTFNFDFILNLPLIIQKDLTICTFSPEENNYNQKRISYVYADLRELPFKNEYFDEIVCQSTLEHINMDNSIYGYKNTISGKDDSKSYEYLIAVKELMRVLKKGGLLIFSFPFGKFENHGFFQQFDDEMLGRLIELLEPVGTLKLDFMRYTPEGWIFTSREECKDIVSYNPHTGIGKGTDGAAHCRSICFIHFIKVQI